MPGLTYTFYVAHLFIARVFAGRVPVPGAWNVAGTPGMLVLLFFIIPFYQFISRFKEG